MPTPNFEDVDAATMPHLVLVPGERLGDMKLSEREWGVALGNPWAAALVIVGTRDDVLAALTRARDELLSYYTAEHENAYHNAAPEAQCPMCRDDAS